MKDGLQIGDRQVFRWTLLALVVGLGGFSLWRVEVLPWRANGGDFFPVFQQFFPPLVDRDFLWTTLGGAAETVAVAILGTMLALAIGIPMGMLSSRAVLIAPRFAEAWQRPSRSARLVSGMARLITALLRSVPEVVWAVILVRVVGLGTTAGVIAIAIAYGGMIAKVAAEQLEVADPAPAAALADCGGSRLGVLLWAQLPLAAPSLSDYAIYRCECAVRASMVMGYVGGGGLGFQIEHSYGYSRYAEVTTQVLVLVLLVVAIEYAADAVRRWWA